MKGSPDFNKDVGGKNKKGGDSVKKEISPRDCL